MKNLYLIVIVCLLLTACGSKETMHAGMDMSAKPTFDVKLEITGKDVKVKVDTNMHISPEHYGAARKIGEGHIHMYLDNGEKIGVTSEEQIFKDLAPGMHNLKISLHNNDHTPYDLTKNMDFEIK
jgi:hypothetical protein